MLKPESFLLNETPHDLDLNNTNRYNHSPMLDILGIVGIATIVCVAILAIDMYLTRQKDDDDFNPYV